MECTQCLLCPSAARPKASWSSVLDFQVAKSLSKLLEEYSEEAVLEIFRDADYCWTCQEFVLEIDLLMRSFSVLQAKILNCRTRLNRCLVDNVALWTTGENRDLCDINNIGE